MTSSDSDTESFYDAEDMSPCSAGSVRCEISFYKFCPCWGGTAGCHSLCHCQCQCQSVRLSVSVTLITLLQRVPVLCRSMVSLELGPRGLHIYYYSIMTCVAKIYLYKSNKLSSASDVLMLGAICGSAIPMDPSCYQT